MIAHFTMQQKPLDTMELLELISSMLSLSIIDMMVTLKRPVTKEYYQHRLCFNRGV